MKYLLFISIILAVVAANDRHLLYKRTAVPKGWRQFGRAATHEKVHFMIALKQQNLDILDSTFWAIATPGNPLYRNFMNKDEILDIIAPKQEDHDLVMFWIRSAANEKTVITSHRDAIEVVTTVDVAENLFQTHFFHFRNSDTGKKVIKAMGAMSVPSELGHLIHMVEGISTFPVRKYKTHSSPLAQEGIIPQSLAELYQIPALTKSAYSETSVGPIEFEAQNYAPSDLSAFAQEVKIDIAPLTKAHTVGPNDPTSPQIEATLDIEYTSGVNNAATGWFWLEDGDGWLYQYVVHVFGTSDIPQVQSISYGWSESNQCDIDPDTCQQLGVDSQGYVERVNTEFQKIGMRGVSIFVSSGDSGANGRTDPDCTLPYLKPDYPGCSPYITSVGATQINSPKHALKNPPPICSGQGYSCVSGGTEVAVTYDHAGFASGGGFSNYAPRPSYQDAAVQAYLKSNVKFPPSSYFNSSNRGYPDVAAVGADVLIYQQGVEAVGGTSCSSPEFAGVAAILNHYAIAKDGKPLGFLNPFLYQMQAADSSTFHDITVGNNLCTEDGCSSSCKGFYATTGWDAVTGLGSPNVANMITYVQNNL